MPARGGAVERCWSLGCRQGVKDDPPVEHLDSARHELGNRAVVSDYENGDGALVELGKKGQDGLAGGLIEVARGLVCQDNGRLADEGSGDGHALALSS